MSERGEQVGGRFVAALAAKDGAALSDLIAPEVFFRGMTPRRFWEASRPAEVVAILFTWFDANDVIEAVDDLAVGRVGARTRVDYRLLVRNGDGPHAVEQRAYLDLDDDGRIVRMHVMCAGFQPLALRA